MANPDLPPPQHVLVTGADGYLGRLLARRLLGQVDGPPEGFGRLRPGTMLTLLDRGFGAGHPADAVPAAAPAVRRVACDLRQTQALAAALPMPPDLVFHLAGITSRQAEDDWTLGMQVNLAATLALLERLRALTPAGARPPVWVQASSIGVFGVPLPTAVDDDTAVVPTLSYGTAKRMVELLLADATRRGWVDARSLRLPSVVARPAAPDGALSAFASDLIREPLEGRDYTCPIGPEGTLWLLSGATCAEQLLHAATLPAGGLPPGRAWTLPALHARVDEVVQALGRRHGGATAARVRYRPDPALHAQFARWPTLRTPLADRLGFRHDGTLERLLERAVAD